MNAGIILCFLGALSFGLCACVSKIADRQRCKPSALIVAVFGWAAAFMLTRTLTLSTGFSLPGKATIVAVVFGISAAVAILAFQTSIAFGKVTVAWLVMNLSAGLPALVSIWLYREKLTLLKGCAFVIALIALACLFQGKRQETEEAKRL
jgi:drug/metabolite transporter (DMT)-like permease